jgi:hypothetical protein
MNKQLLTVVVGLLCTCNLFGQIQNDVRKNLDLKDFVAFKKYADNLSEKDKRISSRWECLRDLTAEFKEGVFFFEKFEQDKDRPAINSIRTFRVTIITTKTEITYYELSEMKNRKNGNDWEPYYNPIAKFKDEKQFDKLRSSFKNIFKSDLNENELFITDFVYGEDCGWAGDAPEGRQQINQWVANKNKARLLKWLKSINTEKQIYAADGLFQLKKRGVKITDEELLILKYVTTKSGTVQVCSGCMRSQTDISTVTMEFKQ